ncbi:MAG: hypothetical protein O2821_04080 [Chloroflexi bacterium]|nr:hypothetical protein [Chloroflexota bacterium]MDA1227041.1 hypothetical protein [Chloroflexota bacterium]
MEIIGVVVSGGDVSPTGISDGPHRFQYDVRLQDGSVVKLAYTAFPPSPAGDIENAKIMLNFHEGVIKPGHHVQAQGTYNPDSNTLTVKDEGNFIETSSDAPG